MFREITDEKDAVVVKERVSLKLGVTRYLRRYPKRPVVFTSFEGEYLGRIVGGAFSSRERLAKWLNLPSDGVSRGLSELLNRRGEARVVEGSEHKIYGPDAVERLPIPTYYPTDGGPYLTASIVSAEAPEGWTNLSFHRMMLLAPYEEGRLVVRVVPRHLHRIYHENLEAGEETPIAVSVGVGPWLLVAAATSLPWGDSEMGYAAALKEAAGRGPLEVVKKAGYPPYPKEAEIVLLGKLLEERAPEGPFVDITSTIDLSGMEGQPVFQVEKVLLREVPHFHALLPAGSEHYLLMGLPREVMILKSVASSVAGVKDVRLTEGGAGWLHAVISIRKRKEGEGKNAILAAFAGHPSLKHVVVVDEDIDISKSEEVEWAIATRMQADRDLIIIKGARGSTLDPSAGETTAKMGLDATAPLKDRERFSRVKLEGE
ncbi:MAG TPA: UbiD family decarboxylase [Euryarchaeota archaeon]|nr:MAG: UbiD family decarboxylase [Thermoplasmata archaeon]HDD59679.1 UbiD family decarboxylase [Euryarchaeota archaeon]